MPRSRLPPPAPRGTATMHRGADKQTVGYSHFACIDSGFATIALGATLRRWHGITDVRFFERHSTLCGTWFVNTYPGNRPPSPFRPASLPLF